MRYTCWMAVAIVALSLGAVAAWGSTTDALIADLAGQDEVARARARQLLPRGDIVAATPKVVALVGHENQAIWRAAFNVLMDFSAEVSVPGREAERAEVARQIMTLIASEQPQPVRERGLRLLPLVVPAGFGVGPMAALLAEDNPILREKARAALEETGTPEAAGALRAFLPKARPEFQCAILNSLGILKDADSLPAIEELTKSPDAKVRAAAARALAWTGDPFRLAAVKRVMKTADEATRSEVQDAFVRLVNAIEERGGNWEIAVAIYLDLLGSPDPVLKQAGFAGLGRIGDSSCVGKMLATLHEAEAPVLQVGLDALRRMQGVDVTRALVTAYPDQPAALRVALLEALGSKKHPMVLPILTDAAKSSDPALRAAALNALAETELLAAVPVLIEATGRDESAGAARPAWAGILRIADALRAQGKKKEAGQAYLAAAEAIRTNDEWRSVLQGITACPVPEALPVVQRAAQIQELKAPTAQALVAVGEALTAAKRSKEAIAAFEAARELDNSSEMTKRIAAGLRKAGAAADAAAMLGLLTNWWVVGPFELGENNAGWDKAYVGEPDVSLTARYMTGKRRVEWQPVKASDDRGVINLHKPLGPGDNRIGYAYTEVEVAQDTDALLLLGVDDSERVWVNGEKVFELFVPRGMTPDQDKIPVKLKAGRNTILLKIWQNTLGWEFCARLTLPDGRPVEFTQKK